MYCWFVLLLLSKPLHGHLSGLADLACGPSSLVLTWLRVFNVLYTIFVCGIGVPQPLASSELTFT